MSASDEYRRISRVALGDLIHRAASRHGDRLAVVDGERRVSHRELDALSSQFAHYLLGQRRGPHVATLCANSIDMLVAIYGINKAGLVWVPINIALSPQQIGYILRHADVTCVVVDEDIIARPDISAMLSNLDLAVVVSRPAGSSDHSTVSTACSGSPSELPDVEISGDQLALIMYTSGTTGDPKGVMHSHSSACSAIIANVATLAVTESDVMSAMLPLFHCAQHVLATSTLAAGAAIVLTRGFDPAGALRMIGDERLTIFGGLPMMYAAVLDHPGAPNTDEAGEIVHRGPNIMLGYYRDPEATAAAQAFGWHHTGDLGVIDAEGQLLFLDRKKDMIKTGGENVPSVKVEAVLLAHPAIADAAVIGVLHPHWSEAVLAVVVLGPGQYVSPTDLLEHCRERLAGFQVPKDVVFVSDLPHTATGKIRKSVLRHDHEKHFAHAEARPDA
ncbi:MAG TPA: AMP-binding protein [Jatrophihabitantaceae bacterium]